MTDRTVRYLSKHITELDLASYCEIIYRFRVSLITDEQKIKNACDTSNSLR